MTSGDEFRRGYWTKGRRKWALSKEDLTIISAKEIEAFFRARKGKLYGFRLRDWQWYKVEDESLPLLDGTSAQLQFVYPDNINAEIQIVTKPTLLADVNADISDTFTYAPDITLKRDTGSGFITYPSSGNWTLDRTTGLIEFDNDETGNDFTWSGSYDWPVRFDVDEMGIKREAFNIFDWSGIEFIELKQ
jgi:hypothetical protein